MAINMPFGVRWMSPENENNVSPSRSRSTSEIKPCCSGGGALPDAQQGDAAVIKQAA
jgi:hypothetical protein